MTNFYLSLLNIQIKDTLNATTSKSKLKKTTRMQIWAEWYWILCIRSLKWNKNKNNNLNQKKKMNNRKNNNLKMKEIKRMSLNSQKLPIDKLNKSYRLQLPKRRTPMTMLSIKIISCRARLNSLEINMG